MTARGPARLVGWTGGPVRPAPSPPMVPVQRGIVEELRAAVADWETSPESQRGECRDRIVAVAVALRDDAEGDQR